jgi:DNA-binding CsgD family transcriptional regulator
MLELTSREHTVMRLVIEGQQTKQIARLLGCASKTVESHRINAFEKLGAINGPHAAALYVRRYE